MSKFEELNEKIHKCKNLQMNDLNINDLDNIDNIKVDEKKSSRERILDFLNCTKNPYAFNVDGKIVQISFSQSNVTADECIYEAFSQMYKN